jgi:hypothetical protein
MICNFLMMSDAYGVLASRPLDDPTPSATTPGSSLAIKRNADGSLTLT